MANPFLMLDDDIPEVGGFGEPEPINDPTSNPFLMAQASQDNIDYGDIENPFSQATNPFAGFGDSSGVAEEEPAANAIFDPQSTEPNVSEVATKVYKSHERNAAAMSFFHTTITDDDDDHLEDPELSKHAAGHEESTQGLINISDNESNNKKPPPRPVPPATQELILTVADQLDQTSSHLLGRLPVTRTPSPVNMRDLHTPSPTPDNLVDLLDISDDQKHHIEPDLLGNHMDDDSSNPFGVPVVAEKHPPHRPEPPHVHHGPPPPRPVPPPVTHPHPVEPVTQEPDLFDMFGDNAPKRPPPPKTKEDILSLFSPKPAEVIKPDLLSDDIIHVSPPVVHPATPMPQDAPQQSVATNAYAEDISMQRNQENFEEMNIMNPLSPELSTQVEQLSDSPKVKYTDVEKENILDESDKAEVMSDISAADSTIFNSPNPNVVMEEIVETVPKRQSPEVIQPAITHPARPPPPAVVPRISPEANPFASDVNAPTEVPVSHITHSPARPPPPAPPKRTIVPAPSPVPAVMPVNTNVFADIAANDEFDAFAAKFESVKKEEPNTLGVGGPFSGAVTPTNESAWGDDASFGDGSTNGFDDGDGFGNDDGDAFMSMGPPQIQRSESRDSDDEKDFTFSIRPIDANSLQNSATPVLAPPPRTSQNNSIYSADSPPRVNPFDSTGDYQVAQEQTAVRRTDSQETPPTPLFDDDISQPLEEFPRISYTGSGWEMQLRQPNKKKITGQRFWKKIYLRLVYQGDTPVCQLYNLATDKTPFQELPLQACYSVSEISAQQFDQFGKIFTLKLQYIFYKERPGVRPGQVTKAERITSKLSQFAAYAIQGDYQGVKEFGSDLKKLGLPVEHAPQITQLFKIGSMNYEDLKQFSVCIEEALFKMSVHRDRALNYKMEEVQVTAVDELYVEQDADGHILKQIARVRLFFLAFLSGMPTIELGVNDMWRQGKEVVGRHDIIPVETEEWIRLEGVEYNSVVQLDEYDRTRIIRFQPPDANYIELMRFRVRPPRNRELPLQLKATWVVTGNKVELRADILVPGFASRKLGQIPCEDVSVRFPIPECWIYLFRVEKHFRYGSVKSAHRRTGKIKGIERILGTVDTLQESLIEVTSGQAKYEHHHRAIVWRCPRLPKEGQGAYTTHQMVVRMALTSYDQIPEQLAPYCYVEFTMPATVVSHFTVRSVSVQDSDSDDPPEKYVRYLARNEYKVAIEHTTGDSVNPYLAATAVSKQPIREEPTPQPAPSPSPMVGSDSDSDSN